MADGDDAATTVVVVMTGDDVVVVRVDGGPPDLAVVDGLALTLALEAQGRRCGRRSPRPSLTGVLLDLCGCPTSSRREPADAPWANAWPPH